MLLFTIHRLKETIFSARAHIFPSSSLRIFFSSLTPSTPGLQSISSYHTIPGVNHEVQDINWSFIILFFSVLDSKKFHSFGHCANMIILYSPPPLIDCLIIVKFSSQTISWTSSSLNHPIDFKMVLNQTIKNKIRLSYWPERAYNWMISCSYRIPLRLADSFLDWLMNIYLVYQPNFPALDYGQTAQFGQNIVDFHLLFVVIHQSFVEVGEIKEYLNNHSYS